MIKKDKLYKDCSEITLSKFLDVLIDGDYSSLVKERGLRRRSVSELKDKWADIYDEYIDITNSDNSLHYYELVKTIAIASAKIYTSKVVLQSIARKHNKELVDSLKFIGLNVKIREGNWDRDLKKVFSRIKVLTMELNEAKKDIAPYLVNSDVKLNRNDFLESLPKLSKFQGYRINPDDVTVLEYSVILKKYIEECQRK